jgi:hypothetical protein
MGNKAMAVFMLGGVILLLAMGLFQWFQSNVHISYHPEQIPTLQAEEANRKMGTLPADMCLTKDGRPYFVQAGSANAGILFGISLTYVSKAGDLVVVNYLQNDISGIPAQHIYHWSGYGCPTQ